MLSRKSAQPPLFSVVIPVSNKRPHLQRAIDSVLRQSVPDFELLLIDDASSDGSATLLAAQTDPRVRLLRRSAPGPGGYAARNLGIAAARGAWVALLDADDEWLRDHLAAMHRAAEMHPTAAFLSAGWETVDGVSHPRLDPMSKTSGMTGSRWIGQRDYLQHHLRGIPSVWTSVVCLRRDALRQPVFPDDGLLHRGGDTQAWLDLVAQHGGLVRSHHLGARYHTNSVAMVTKSAPYRIPAFTPDAWQRMREATPLKEQALLRAAFCSRTLNDCISARLSGCRPRLGPTLPVLIKCPIMAVRIAAWYLAPQWLLDAMRKVRRVVRSRSGNPSPVWAR